MRVGLRGIGIVLAVLAVSLAGCKSLSACSEPTGYGNDETIPPLEIPAGLEPPDTRNALKGVSHARVRIIRL